jgi:hypothetical protein
MTQTVTGLLATINEFESAATDIPNLPTGGIDPAAHKGRRAKERLRGTAIKNRGWLHTLEIRSRARRLGQASEERRGNFSLLLVTNAEVFCLKYNFTFH